MTSSPRWAQSCGPAEHQKSNNQSVRLMWWAELRDQKMIFNSFHIGARPLVVSSFWSSSCCSVVHSFFLSCLFWRKITSLIRRKCSQATLTQITVFWVEFDLDFLFKFPFQAQFVFDFNCVEVVHPIYRDINSVCYAWYPVASIDCYFVLYELP